MLLDELRTNAITIAVFLSLPIFAFALYARFTDIPLDFIIANIKVSILRMIAAYSLAAGIGWLCAALFYKGRRARIALPIFDVLQSVPTYAALPLAVSFFGPSEFTIIFFLVLAIVWPIFFSVVSSLKMIRTDWEEAVSIAKLSREQYIQKFLWPASVPGLITGSIIGLGDGWEALIATEIILESKQGLGPFFQAYANDPVATTFGILAFLVLIFSINRLVWLPLLEWSHKMHEE